MTNTILLKKEVKKLLHFKSDTSLYTLEQRDKTFPQKIMTLPMIANLALSV